MRSLNISALVEQRRIVAYLDSVQARLAVAAGVTVRYGGRIVRVAAECFR